MSAGGTTNQLAVPPRAEDIELIAEVRQKRRDFIDRVVAEPTRFAPLLKSARSDAALVDLLVVKVLQEMPSVGKVESRRALAGHGHDEFVGIGQLSDADIESLMADVLQ
jgi:hypothetical protein